MASSSAPEDAASASKKRGIEDTNDDEFGPSAPKRAKLGEVGEDDFGPAMPTPAQLEAKDASKKNHNSEWAKVRLEAEVGDVSAVDEMLKGTGQADWMTVLPPERIKSDRLDFDKMQQSVTAFSKRGMQTRGDTSGWTDTPADRAARESGSAKMSSIDMARQMAAQRFQKEEDIEARTATSTMASGQPVLSLYEQVKTGQFKKDKSSRRRHSSSESSSDYSSDSSSSSDDRRRSHKHKRHKEKSRDKHRHKDKRSDEKRKSKDKKKEKKKSSEYDEQTPKAMSTSTAFKGNGYWDRERDLDRFGARDSEKTRAQTFRDASMLNTRFQSGGSSSGSSLR